jgi:hypothetical protein
VPNPVCTAGAVFPKVRSKRGELEQKLAREEFEAFVVYHALV